MRLPLFSLAVLALVVLAVPVWMALQFVMPWFVFGLLMWAAFSVWRGPRRRRWSGDYRESRQRPWRHRPYTSQEPTPPAPPRPRAPRPAARAELPIEVEVKVEQIRRKVEVLLGFAPRFPPFSKDLYIVRQTASDYLPRTINAYLALPAGQGERLLTANGKTALQELKEQLDLLDGKLDDIAGDLQRKDLDRLLANRRFLEQRFGSANS